MYHRLGVVSSLTWPYFPMVQKYFNHASVGPTPYETVLSYHSCQGNDITDKYLKSSIFAEADDLLITKNYT
jgi:hypothetical protein